MSTDPFSLTYNWLWSLLESHSSLTALVEARNRIRYIGAGRDPHKDQITTSDLPEIRIIPSLKLQPHAHRTSSSSSFMRRFDVQITSGSLEISEAFYPVCWEVYRALATWVTSTPLPTWKDRTFIRNLLVEDSSDGVPNPELVRSIRGWVSIWTVAVELWFNTQDLLGD